MVDTGVFCAIAGPISPTNAQTSSSRRRKVEMAEIITWQIDESTEVNLWLVLLNFTPR